MLTPKLPPINLNFARHKVGVCPSQTKGLLVIKFERALGLSKHALNHENGAPYGCPRCW